MSETRDFDGDAPPAPSAEESQEINRDAEEVARFLGGHEGAAGGGADESSNREEEELARSAVTAVNKLEIRGFLNQYYPNIFKKLKECDDYAEKADFNGNMMFVALALPVVNGIIHLASTRDALSRANKWLMKKWNLEWDQAEPEKVPVLSALTLIYITAKGWEEFQNDPEESKVWERIRDRVQLLSSESFENVVDEDKKSRR